MTGRADRPWTPGAALLLAGAMSVAMGCGGAADNWDGPDAGTGSCFMSLAVSPPLLQAPATVTLTGAIERSGELQGIESYTWQVMGAGGQALAVTANDPDSRSVWFQADEPGVYSVWLTGSVGGMSCSASNQSFNVIDGAARTARYRLRAVPGAELAAPVQDVMITVLGGADAVLEPVVLGAGVTGQGRVESADGQPLAAYLRARPAAAGQPVREGFAGQDGQFWLRLLEGVYDVLVIPEDNSVAPVQVAQMSVSAGDGPVTVTVAPGHVIAGAVVDSAGAPVAGARVSMRVAGVPSTMATTAADGWFELRTSALGPASLTVVPAAGSELPELEVAVDAGLMIEGDSVNIAYAALATRAVAVPARLSDGVTAAPGARITWIARPVAAAGQVTAGAQSVTATGTLRRAVVAGPDGATAAVSLIAGIYDVIVEPGPDPGPGQAVAVRQVDLVAGQAAPEWLALAPPARITGVVTRGPDAASDPAEAEPAGAVEVRATPTGLLGRTLAAAASATTAADGSFELVVPGAGSYDLAFLGSDDATGRAWLSVQAPASGHSLALGTVALPATLTLSGQVRIPGLASAEGVHLMVLCAQCAGVDAERPVAEAVTGAGGSFALHVPDPGRVTTAPASRASAEADAR